MKKDKVKLLGALGIGTILGGTLGILFAPKKGSETREDIKLIILNIRNKTNSLDKNKIKKYIDKELDILDYDINILDETINYKKAKKLGKKIIKRINKLIKYVEKKELDEFNELITDLKDTANDISTEVLNKLDNDK